MTEPTQELIIQSQRTLLARYGSRKELKEMADRLQRVMTTKPPHGDPRKLNQTEALLLAAGSLAHGLDPLLHEIWLLYDRDGNPILYVGPDGYQKAADKQIKEQGGGNWWVEERPLVDPDRRKLLGIPPDAHAWECRLYDTPTMRTYTETIKGLSQSGAPWEDIKKIVGEQPCTIGIGWYLPTPQTAKQDAQFPPTERAKKRALHHALSTRFNLVFQGESDGVLPDEFSGQLLERPEAQAAAGSQIIEGATGGSGDTDVEAPIVTQEPAPPLDPETKARVENEIAERMRAANSELYNPPEEPPTEPEQPPQASQPQEKAVGPVPGEALATLPGQPATTVGQAPTATPPAAPAAPKPKEAEAEKGPAKPKIAALEVSQKEQPEWSREARKFAKKFSAYQTVSLGAATGMPDYARIRRAAGEAGYKAITDSNWQTVLEELGKKAAKKS